MLIIKWKNNEHTATDMNTKTAGTFAKFLNDGGRYLEWNGVLYIGAFIDRAFVRVTLAD